jgi:molecular chaperone GrpE
MFPKKKESPKEENRPQPMEQALQEAQEPQKQVEELRKQVEGLQKEKDDIFAKLQRVAADYDNYQKRSARQITDSIAYEKEKIIKALLPVLDDFERVLAHSENADSVVEGLKIVYEHLKAVLRSQGVEQIESQCERFDPTHHEAITQRAESGKEDGVILEELQKGYKLNGRVIRASRVVVNKVAGAGQIGGDEGQRAEEPETKDTQ